MFSSTGNNSESRLLCLNIVATPCNHKFHEDCILLLLTGNRNGKNRCPRCAKELSISELQPFICVSEDDKDKKNAAESSGNNNSSGSSSTNQTYRLGVKNEPTPDVIREGPAVTLDRDCEDQICSICKECVKHKSGAWLFNTVRIPCNHVFHDVCILQFLDLSEKLVCPD